MSGIEIAPILWSAVPFAAAYFVSEEASLLCQSKVGSEDASVPVPSTDRWWAEYTSSTYLKLDSEDDDGNSDISFRQE